MMLVDKEELLKVMTAHCSMCKKRTDYYPSKCRICDLDNGIDIVEVFPSVDAIPVEWVEQWLKRSENTYSRQDVCEMLDEWRKENESNSNS